MPPAGPDPAPPLPPSSCARLQSARKLSDIGAAAQSGFGLTPEAVEEKRVTRAAASGPVPAPGPAAAPKQPRAAAAAAAGGSRSRKGAGGGGKAAAARRRPLACVAIEGETFRVGESAFVVLDTAYASEGEDEEDAACAVCGSTDKESEAMVECSRCLAGVHLSCMRPPLAEVPEGDYLCASCEAGKAPPPRTARERVLQQQGLGLARLEAMWREGDGEYRCRLRWYCVPEETHTGRKVGGQPRAWPAEGEGPSPACLRAPRER